MKQVIIASIFVFLGISLSAQYTPDENFNNDWRFYKGAAEGAELVTFNDANWRVLDLPHDWAIEGPFDRKYDCRMGGLPVFRTGWYRKHFTMDASDKDKVVRIEFEGAMYNSHIWVNGQKVGHSVYQGNLYTAVTTISEGDKVLDTYKSTFGIRNITYNAVGRYLAYVTVSIDDKKGNFCPLANNLVKFEESGAGKIVGVGNGNHTSLESFQAPQRKAFNGLALVILNSNKNETGTIKLTAKSKGLKPSEITINTK